MVLVLGSALQRAVRPSASEAELPVIVAPLHLSALDEWDPKLLNIFNEDHLSSIKKYKQDATDLESILKSLLARAIGTVELADAVQSFGKLDGMCQQYGVDVEDTVNLKGKVRARASASLDMSNSQRREKFMSGLKLEKQATSQPLLVCENIHASVQSLQSALGLGLEEHNEMVYKVMKALASMCALVHANLSTLQEVEEVGTLLAEAKSVMESSKGDIVQCLNLNEGEVEELQTVIANGEESVTKARAEDRDKRMAKLQPCRNATDIMAMLKDIPLPNSFSGGCHLQAEHRADQRQAHHETAEGLG